MFIILALVLSFKKCVLKHNDSSNMMPRNTGLGMLVPRLFEDKKGPQIIRFLDTDETVTKKSQIKEPL